MLTEVGTNSTTSVWTVTGVNATVGLWDKALVHIGQRSLFRVREILLVTYVFHLSWESDCLCDSVTLTQV